MNTRFESRPRLRGLLSSRLAWGLYSLGWLVFAAGFAAVFLIQQSGTVLGSMLSSSLIVLPAALIGVGIIRLCERMPAATRFQARGLAFVGLLCVAYPALWIAAVNLMNNRLALVHQDWPRWRFPPAHVLHWHYLSGTMICIALVAVTYGYAYVIEAETRRLRAEWRSLRGQLSPHFLFNTLHTLFALAQADPDAGEDGVERLSRVMRYALLAHRDDVEAVSLDEEWRFTEDYLHLETMRLDGTLRWRSQIAENARTCAIPPLLLQPLVENSVRHATAPRGCTITVQAHLTDGDLVIRVSDDGPGADGALLLRSPGLGLRATRTRMAMLSSRADAMSIITAPDAGFAVQLRLPYRAADAAHGATATFV